MTTVGLLEDLEQVQSQIRTTAEQLDDHDYRQQYHTDLSPLGWHIGHCSFIETYWLREIVLENPAITGNLHQLYFPENIPKPQRGPALPVKPEHLDWCKTLNQENHGLLASPPPKLQNHDLSKDDYLGKFILQHHAQHLETIYMVLQQRALKQGADNYAVGKVLQAAVHQPATRQLPPGNYRIGSENAAEAFDNEVPPHDTSLAGTNFACQPVSNAEWLAFMQDGGYTSPSYWSDDGWQWREESQTDCPEHWQRDKQGNWFGLDHTGAHDLDEHIPVCGINYFEANAFVNWMNSAHSAGARLPHEYEWEAAASNDVLENPYLVWEWCANTFYPYEGFSPFPYDNYSKPWFDNNHYVLRGGSKQTCDIIKRNSFRNFYNPDKRHIFSGLRLAFD